MKKLVVLAIFTMFVAGIASAQTSDNTIPLVDGFEDGDVEEWTGDTGDVWMETDPYHEFRTTQVYLYPDNVLERPFIGNQASTLGSDIYGAFSRDGKQERNGMELNYLDSQGNEVVSFETGLPSSEDDMTIVATVGSNNYTVGHFPATSRDKFTKIRFKGLGTTDGTIVLEYYPGGNTYDSSNPEINATKTGLDFSNVTGSSIETVQMTNQFSSRAFFFDNVYYGTGQLPAIESASNQPVDAGEMVSYQADISSINPEQTSNGVNVTVTTGDGTQVTEAEMTYNSTSGLWEANGIHNAYGGVEYSYEFEAFNQYGENTETGSFRTNTPSFIVGQTVQGTVEGTYSLNPDYEYTDGDVEYYYEKKYVYHNGDIVEEGNWERINLAGSSSAVDYTVSQSFERQTEATGNYSIETKVVKASSTYNWDADGDREYTVDSGQWRDYNFETIGTVRYNYQVVSAMETPSPLDALGGFFTDIVGGIIDTITGIFDSEPTAVPQPGTPPTPASN